MKMTFKDFLVEFTTDTDSMQDPRMRQSMMRRMRATDDKQADRMDDRMQRDAEREDRKNLQAEKDPKKKMLMRKRQTLKRQLDNVSSEITDTGDQEENVNS